MTDSDEDREGGSEPVEDRETASEPREDREVASESDADRGTESESPADHDAESEVDVSFEPDETPGVETGGDSDPSSFAELGESSSGDGSADSEPDGTVAEGGESSDGGDDPERDDTSRDGPSRGPFVEDLAAEVREEYDTAPDDEADDPPDIFADRRSTGGERASGERASGDAEALDDETAASDDTTASNDTTASGETTDDPFAERSPDGALDGRADEDGQRRAPLSDLADEVRRDAEAVDPDDDPLFEPAGTDDAGPSGWDRLDEESEEFSQPDAEPAAEPVDETGQEHVVDKRQYCQQCPHLAEPPELGCTHEGTEIVEVTDAEHFRVRACPVIGEDGPNFDAVDDPDDGD